MAWREIQSRRLSRRRRTGGQRRLREARWREVRKLWRSLAQVAAVCLAYDTLVVLLWRHRSAVTFTAGLVDGLMVMLVVWLINTRTYNLTMGTWAEQWTSELFKKHRGWRIVDNFPVDGYDIDHIVISPTEVLVVETKYYGPPPLGRDDKHRERIDRDLATAKRRARRAALLLAEDGIGNRRGVVPVLMLWGVGVPDELGAEVRGGVWVANGNEPGALIERFGTKNADPRHGLELETALRSWLGRADALRGNRQVWGKVRFSVRRRAEIEGGKAGRLRIPTARAPIAARPIHPLHAVGPQPPD